MRGACFAAVFFVASTIAAAASSQVNVSIHDGRITVVARDATLADILDAWSRAGGMRVVNAETIGGPPFTILLSEVPEEDALQALLRSVSGYLAVPRSTVAPDRSHFERIVILPSSTPSRGAVELAPIPAPGAVAPTNMNGVARLLGADGRPVEDDQADAPHARPTDPTR